MTKAIAKKSGFYVGLLGSPGWETKHSVFIGGGPTHIFLSPGSPTSNRRRFPFGSLTTTILHKVPAQCKITSTRLAPDNVLRIKPQQFNSAVVFSPEISLPPPAMVTPKRPNLRFDTKPSPMRRSSSRLTTQDEQHDDFHSNGNITCSSGPRKLVSGLNLLQSRIDQNFNVSPVSNERRSSNTYNSSVADITVPTQTFRTLMKHSRLPTDLLENGIQQPTIKPLHFGKRRHTISEKSYSDNANDSILETVVHDCPDVSLPWASYKTPDLPKTRCQSVDLSSNSVWLKSRCSSPTRQTRNSPIIGPSPLRTMSLPLDYEFEHTKQFNVDNCNMLSEIQSEAKFAPSLESPPSLSHTSPPPEQSRTLFQADDQDIILDLIRELAQETSAWDASLFVDENFKALMDQSTVHPNSKPKVQIVPEKWSKYRRKYRRTTLQDIPESDGTKYNLLFSKALDKIELDSYSFSCRCVFRQLAYR